jgi:hypothetical protein
LGLRATLANRQKEKLMSRMKAAALLVLALLSLSWAVSAASASSAQQTSALDAQRASGTVCDLCEDVMGWIDGRLAPNDTAPEIEEVLRAACDDLFNELPYVHTLVPPPELNIHLQANFIYFIFPRDNCCILYSN